MNINFLFFVESKYPWQSGAPSVQSYQSSPAQDGHPPRFTAVSLYIAQHTLWNS